MRAVTDHNVDLLTRAVSNSFGEDTTSIGPSVLSRAEQRLSSGFGKVAAPQAVQFDQSQMATRLDQAARAYEGLLRGDTQLLDNRLVAQAVDIATSPQGTATAERLHALSVNLGKRAAAEMKGVAGDRQLGMALFDVKNVVDDALMSGMSASEQTAFQTLRGEYRNFIRLLSNPKIINESSGKVNGQSLATMLAKTDRIGYTFGRNDSPMYTLARFFEAFPPLPDPGTARASVLPWYAAAVGASAAAGPQAAATTAAGLPLAGLGLNLATRGYLSGSYPAGAFAASQGYPLTRSLFEPTIPQR
jgi:hypothetical protein